MSALIELAQVDAALAAMEKARRDLPETLASIDTQVAAHREKVAALATRHAAAQKARRDAERALEEEVERIKQLNARIPLLKTNKEYQALLKEMEIAKEEQSRREDVVLGLLTDIERLTAELEEARSTFERIEKELQGKKGEVERSLSEFAEREPAEKARRARLARDLPAETLHTYETVRARMGTAVAPVVHKVCDGCHRLVAPQLLNELQRNTSLVTCPTCFRILYWTEASA